MKYLKSYKIFDSFSKYDLNIGDIKDIFSFVEDEGFQVSATYFARSFSIGDLDILKNKQVYGSESFVRNYFSSFSIRLDSIRKDESEDISFILSDEVYDEIKNSISHVESEYSLKLDNIYIDSTSGIRFRNVDIMKNTISKLTIGEQKRFASFMNLTFRIL